MTAQVEIPGWQQRVAAARVIHNMHPEDQQRIVENLEHSILLIIRDHSDHIPSPKAQSTLRDLINRQSAHFYDACYAAHSKIINAQIQTCEAEPNFHEVKAEETFLNVRDWLWHETDITDIPDMELVNAITDDLINPINDLIVQKLEQAAKIER